MKIEIEQSNAHGLVLPQVLYMISNKKLAVYCDSVQGIPVASKVFDTLPEKYKTTEALHVVHLRVVDVYSLQALAKTTFKALKTKLLDTKEKLGLPDARLPPDPLLEQLVFHVLCEALVLPINKDVFESQFKQGEEMAERSNVYGSAVVITDKK